MKRALFITFSILSVLILVGWVTVFLLRPPVLVLPEKVEIFLKDVTIIVPGQTRLAGQSILIRDSRIDQIIPADTSLTANHFSKNNYRGAFVLPGLIDMHGHFPPDIAVGNPELFAFLFLMHGVTTVRDMGSAGEGIFELRKKIQNGDIPGPRIFSSGAIIDGNPAVFPTNLVIEHKEDAVEAVRKLAEKGADFVKVYNSILPEVLAAIQEEAARRSIPVIGHVPVAIPFETANLADVQHFTGVPVFDDPEAVQFLDYRFEDIIGVDSLRIQEIIRVSLEKDIAHTPTLINQVSRRQMVDPGNHKSRSTVKLLPSFWQTAWHFIWKAPYETGGGEIHHQFTEKMKWIAGQFHQSGVSIHAGTDTMMPYVIPGESLHGELQQLVEAGLTPEAALAAATSVPRAFLSDNDLGNISEGAPADLLIFREDPTKNLAALSTMEAVIADGRLYSKDEFQAYHSRYQAHFHSAFYENIMGFIVGLAKYGFAK